MKSLCYNIWWFAKRSPHWLMTMLLLDLFTHWWALMGDQTVGSDVWIDVDWLLPVWCIWPLGIYIAFEWPTGLKKRRFSATNVAVEACLPKNSLRAWHFVGHFWKKSERFIVPWQDLGLLACKLHHRASFAWSSSAQFTAGLLGLAKYAHALSRVS